MTTNLTPTASHRGGSIGHYNVWRSYKNGPKQIVKTGVTSMDHSRGAEGVAFAMWREHGDESTDWYYDVELIGYSPAVPPPPKPCCLCGK